ncbi:MAG: hypothetical protein N3D82_01935 [Ignisphaera sp.]|nr:hypothetical protein [Ignisphaera sp.]MCX8167780.1 hypothetical protein [Ignisphaera sp.]MDW8085233.1 hypothetical protein [Ignisphaera sp.]
MNLYALVTIIPRNPYEFAKIVKRLTVCNVRNLRANSADNNIHFKVENVDALIGCLEGFDEVFLTVDLRLRLKVLGDRLNELIAVLNAKRMPALYPYRIIAVISSGDYHLAIQRTSNRNIYLIRCLRAKNLDVVLSPSTFLLAGTLDTIKNDINRCSKLLSRALLQSNWLTNAVNG